MREIAYNLIPMWSLGNIRDLTPTNSGTSCDSFIVEAESGKYILRGLTSQRQAEQESAVSQILLETGIGARLIPTHQGTYYVPYGDRYYNLQTFLPGLKPDFIDEQQVIAAGKATAKLHSALAQSHYPFSDEDRFSTVPLLFRTQGISLPGVLFPEGKTTMEERVEYISELEKQLSQNQVIHGDLGSWNMLFNGDKIHIIDFGECRTGDVHFDLAALTCSILAKCDNRDRFLRNFAKLLNSYEEIADPVDLRKLTICVYLWLLRGVLASIADIQDPSKAEKICQHFTSELLRFKFFTKLNF